MKKLTKIVFRVKSCIITIKIVFVNRVKTRNYNIFVFVSCIFKSMDVPECPENTFIFRPVPENHFSIFPAPAEFRIRGRNKALPEKLINTYIN